MKQLLILLSLLMASPMLAQQTFSRVYGQNQQTHINQVLATQSGDFVMAGITYPKDRKYSDLWIAKTDANGEPIWQRSFATPGPEHVYSLVETRDGNYTLVLDSRHPHTGYTMSLIMQFDSYGDLMWSQRFGGEKKGGDQLRALVQTQDGGFAAAGFTGSRGKGKQDLWLLRTDAVGQMRWEQTYGTRGGEMAYALIETKDGGFVLGGKLESGGTDQWDAMLLRTDRNGRGIWRKVVNSPGLDAVEQVVETLDGQYLAAGWGYSDLTESVDARLWRFTPTGQLADTESHGGAEADAFYDLLALPGGGFTALGRTASFDQSPDLWLVGLNERGGILWQERTEGEQPEWGHSLSLIPEGGYLIGGATQSFTQSSTINGYLLKTDTRGRFGPEASSGDADNELISHAQPEPIAEEQPWFKPNLYVLSVGISEYAHEPINLSFAHSDAQAIADRFGQLSGSLFKNVYQRVITNENATLGEIKSGIAWLEQEATQLDMILVFISAHGALDHKGNLYLLPNDVRGDQLFATGLDIRALTEGMNGVPCKKLILLDACHSGQSGHNLLAQAAPKAANVNRAIEELLSKEPGLTVMTSSSGNEFSYENPRWGHGAFTKALLEGLDGSADYNSDEVINLLELNLFVTQRVKDLTGGRQHPYTPINLFGDIPLFLIE